MVNDTFVDFDAGIPLATEYLYDGSGNLAELKILGDIGFGWMEVGSLILTYNGNNKVITIESSNIINPTNTVRDSFAYTNNSAFHTYWGTTEYENNIPVDQYSVSKHLNARGSAMITVYGLGNDEDIWVFSDNQAGYPTGYVVIDTTGGNTEPHEWFYYYYNNSLIVSKTGKE